MKRFLPFLSLAVLMTACSPNAKDSTTTAPDAAATIPAVDTTGLSAFQQWKAQNELASMDEYNQPEEQYEAPAPAPKRAVAKKVAKAPVRKASNQSAPVYKPAPSAQSPAPSSGSGDDVAMSNEGADEAKAETKEGWSKAAKGAVIGGVGGALGGAVINKKNRAVGAVIGGVIGAGGGYVIGRKMDKNDGRVD
jgi:hypothetical protein